MALNTYGLKFDGVLDAVKALGNSEEALSLWVTIFYDSDVIHIDTCPYSICFEDNDYISSVVFCYNTYVFTAYARYSMQNIVDIVCRSLCNLSEAPADSYSPPVWFLEWFDRYCHF